MLIDVDGGLTSLSEHKGFRKFFVARATQIGITGTIQRVTLNNVRIIFETSSQEQLNLLSKFLGECIDQAMLSRYDVEAEEEVTLPHESFGIKTDFSKTAVKGIYSDGDEFEKMSESSSNAEVSILK